MAAFIRTFVICLILALGYLGYRFIGVDSFSPSLKLSDSNPIFSVKKDKYQPKQTETVTETEPVEVKEHTPVDEIQPEKMVKNKKYTHTCYFYSVNGKMIPIKRDIDAPLTIENTIVLLLKGPLISESKKGIYSEIPAGVDLINVQRKDNSIIINLTSNFGNGGGSESIENRLKQLAKTVKPLAPNKNIYLYINGSEVEYLGGEGVFVKQPLE